MAQIGNYEVLTSLKSGGMGDVLLARRRGPGMFEQLVAIKTIRAELAGAETVRAHFLDEAAILAKVNHGAVAGVHDFGEQGNTLYMVMEYVAGINFRDLAELKPPPTIIARAIAEACRGLHAAHELRDLHGVPMGVVHRDISPDNLIIGFDGHVKVIDFGIALIRNRQAPATEFGALKGKPAYMSPEQVKSESIDRRSDIFSLAVVMWELLAQRDMFEGDSLYAIARSVEHQQILPPSHYRGHLPIGLDAVVLNALERNLETRTPTAAAMAEALEDVVMTAGEETLEAWAERNLAPQRDAHRAWLASVVAQVEGEHAITAKGRPAGLTTAVPGQVQPSASVSIAKTEIAGALEPKISTHVGSEVNRSETEQAIMLATKRSKLPLTLVALALTLLGLVAAFVFMRGGAKQASIDAAPPTPVADANGLDAYAPLDSSEISDAAPVDALESVDARGKVKIPTDVIRFDAAPKPTQPDAAPVGQPAITTPTGSGVVTFIADPFANVSIDGGASQGTPFLIKLPAGKHKIVATDPATGQVRLSKTIDLSDGQKIKIDIPK